MIIVLGFKTNLSHDEGPCVISLRVKFWGMRP